MSASAARLAIVRSGPNNAHVNKNMITLRQVLLPRRHSSADRNRRLEKIGIGPDGKPLPLPNTKKLYPRTYPCLVVNQDGSTYSIHAHYPYSIITLPLDPATLSEEERNARLKRKELEKQPKYYSIDDYIDEEEEEFDHTHYRDLLR